MNEQTVWNETRWQNHLLVHSLKLENTILFNLNVWVNRVCVQNVTNAKPFFAEGDKGKNGYGKSVVSHIQKYKWRSI